MKRILVGPIITEKSMNQIAKDNKYTFQVSKDVNKIEIAQAVAKKYKVKVLTVRIINKIGKIKKYRGKPVGKTKGFKKAIVELAKGQKIADFSVKK